MADRKIEIYIDSSEEWIALPKCEYDVTSNNESQLVEMQNGDYVEEYVGERIVITGKYSFVNQADLTKLVGQTRSGGFTSVKYVDLDGTTKTITAKVNTPQATLFKKMSDGVYAWTDIPLKITAKGVI